MPTAPRGRARAMPRSMPSRPYAWFTTLTNVNFDATRFTALIAAGAGDARQGARRWPRRPAPTCPTCPNPPPGTRARRRPNWLPPRPFAAIQRFMDRDGPSVVGLRNLILYGLKGTAAYSEHARVLGTEEAAVSAEFHRISAFLAADPDRHGRAGGRIAGGRRAQPQGHGTARCGQHRALRPSRSHPCPHVPQGRQVHPRLRP